MSTWENINANQLIPSEVVSAVTKMADVLTSALEKPASLDVPSSASIPSPLDAARAVVNALLDTLSALLNGGRIHMLPVPITKTVSDQPPPNLPPTINDLEAALQVTLGPTSTAAADAYANMLVKTGGNAGFYNAFAQSLFDLADPNRPQYDTPTDAVAMAVLLIGAQSFSGIVSAATMLDALVKPKAGMSLAARTVPIPQSATARVVGTSEPPGVGIRVDWDPPPSSLSLRYFPGVSFTVKRYAVIRSTDPKAQRATAVRDLFSTQALTEGLTEGESTVIAIGSGRNSAYLDTAADLDPTVPQYYCVAWECEVSENGVTSILPFNHFSNVVKVNATVPAPYQTGQSPDWIGSKAAIDLFPSLAKTTQVIIEQARVLLKPSRSPVDNINEAIALAGDANKRIAARSTELISDVKRMSAALSQPIPSLYVTQMSSKTGGNAFLLAELARRLGDTTDPSRPPFDNGEYVCGICFVAGAARYADLAATIAFFTALFGPATADNPLLGVLAAIDTVVTQAETAVFGVNMQPLSGAAAAAVDPATGLPPVPSTPVIANSGAPVAGASPDNPNAGDTNVTPTSELC